MKKIILTTLNARYSHSSLALRYLYANLKDLKEDALILEYVINENMQGIAEKILEHEPKIVGISVYIWNADDVHALIEVIKKVSPQTKIILGGPEAGYLPHRVDFSKADYVVQGEGEEVFYQLCCEILSGKEKQENYIKAPMVDLSKIILPYDDYTDHDVQHRYIYVEASRGCPFLCEFCLSAIDEKVRNFSVDILIDEFEKLWQRGVRNFKFIDRTFNINMKFATRILDFFLAKEEAFFAHFEVIPDHFPDVIKEKIALFPKGSLQLEVGIQTLNQEIAKRIDRPLKIEKIKKNIAFLEATDVHMHLDLIVGLPGEDLVSFGKNLDVLTSLSTAEIQIGILKKLSGTTLSRHDEEFGMVYSDLPPFDVLQTHAVPFKQIQQMKRFARFWDLYYNSGNFKASMQLLWKDKSVFESFWDLSLWIISQTQSTWKISLDRLGELLFEYMTSQLHLDESFVSQTIVEDIFAIKGRNIPKKLRPFIKEAPLGKGEKVESSMKRQIARQ
ncbi:MAG: B12-binding domain-containing radical SAM protein [Thiovulaceae bacterium]|nr:B12-binding domain-containing radical SAM protein [Sulfurimonadaceae bacterium]